MFLQVENIVSQSPEWIEKGKDLLIQYGLNFYLDNKFGIEDSPKREKYFNEYFKPAFDTLKLNPKFDYIDDQEVFETEKHMKENEETNGWVNIKKW